MQRPFLLVSVLALLAPGSGAEPPGQKAGCSLLGQSQREKELAKVLEPLRGERFNVSTRTDTEWYSYSFRVCAPLDNNNSSAGLIQYDHQRQRELVLGRINATKLIAGSDWIILTYGDGDNYTTHCQREKRKGMVMISCNPRVLAADFSVILEDREKVSDCFYLFELDSRTACPQLTAHLSTGSILLILVSVLAAVYLLGGFLYQRLITQAKGFEQFPNYSFWQEVGNLTADGCDFVCRSKRPPQPLPTGGWVRTTFAMTKRRKNGMNTSCPCDSARPSPPPQHRQTKPPPGGQAKPCHTSQAKQ